MNLDRLRAIVRGAPGARAAPPLRELTYEPVDGDGQPFARAPISGLRGARVLETPFGETVVVERRFEADEHYGRVKVGACASFDARALTLLTGRPTPAPVEGERRSPVFLDLETTGLSGGAGTVAFLVGCGAFEDGAFVVRQFFLPGFAGERALLHAVAAFLEGSPCLLTYNGRTFDVPVMDTRWLFHRLPFPIGALPHVDMLPPARRIWKQAVDGAERSCRLVHLEDELLGVRREGDVPGWEIPQRYFEFVRSGNAAVVEPVLLHNRLDLMSLAALTWLAQRLVSEGADAAEDACECLALGRLYERAGEPARAEAAYRRATSHLVGDRASRETALHALAVLLRRSRRHAEAAEAWHELLALGHGRSAAAREAIRSLAVHHEHRARDLEAARAYALRQLQAERDPDRREAVRYRLARIERKIGRRAPQPSSTRLLDSGGTNFEF
jgi:uncharacterized protein